jgi:hypothetical protein
LHHILRNDLDGFGNRRGVADNRYELDLQGTEENEHAAPPGVYAGFSAPLEGVKTAASVFGQSAEAKN